MLSAPRRISQISRMVRRICATIISPLMPMRRSMLSRKAGLRHSTHQIDAGAAITSKRAGRMRRFRQPVQIRP